MQDITGPHEHVAWQKRYHQLDKFLGPVNPHEETDSGRISMHRRHGGIGHRMLEMVEVSQIEVVVGELLPAWFPGYRSGAQDLRISRCILWTGAFTQQRLYLVISR